MITGHSGPLAHRLSGDAAEGSTGKSIGSLDAKTAVGYFLILILVSLLGWLYLTQASQVTAAGYRIYELEKERVRLQRENAKLMLEVAELERLENVEARARQLGFVPPEQVEYLVVADYPADHSPSEQVAAIFGKEGLALGSPRQDGIRDEVAGMTLVGWWKQLVSQFNTWIIVQPGSAMAESAP